MRLDEIVIDEEFRMLLPVLPDTRRERLRKSIIDEGKVRDPVVVWRERKILLDGHNRLDLYREESERHMIDPPKVVEMEFPSALAAMEWAIDNQDSRRNWTETEADYARGKLYNETKRSPGNPDPKTAKKPEKNQTGQSVQFDPPMPVVTSDSSKTATEIGEKHGGVSGRKVRRDGDYAAAIDTIAKVNGKAAADIKSGALKMSRKRVVEIAASGDIGKELLALRNGKPAEATATPAEPAPEPKVPTAIFNRVMSLEKSYNALGSGVEWLKNHATQASTKNALAEIEAALKTVFRNIQKLKKQVQ